MVTASASATAPALPYKPRLSIRTVAIPFAARPSARSRYVEAFTPSGLLPSRSVGPEPGTISSTGASGVSGAAGDSRVPRSGPSGPGASSGFSRGSAAAALTTVTATAALASKWRRQAFISSWTFDSIPHERVGQVYKATIAAPHRRTRRTTSLLTSLRRLHVSWSHRETRSMTTASFEAAASVPVHGGSVQAAD